MNNIVKQKLKELPTNPGVYRYYDREGRLIYIGKASVLKNRVKSYFLGAHDSKTEKLVSEITDIKWEITSSVIEAIILESNLIKRYKPKYNILSKDDKSFIQIALTKEEFPRFLAIRPTDKKRLDTPIQKYFGPYTNASSVKEILSIFRRIFTFRDCSKNKFEKYSKKNIHCLFYPIRLCPAPCAGKITQKDYANIVNQMMDFLEGRKKRVIGTLKKQMQTFSRMQMYEQAAIIRNRIFAFTHINDIALIKRERTLEQYNNIPSRIEAYDISNIGKYYAVGSMIVFTGGEIDKNEYRKFKIHHKSDTYQTQNSTNNTEGQNDPAMIGQILDRRLNHQEWAYPDLILIDGGKGQLSAALKVLKKHKLKIPVIAVAKGPTRKGFQLFKNSLATKITLEKNFIESVRDEAHRFAITYHRKLRSRSLSNN
jgi:excinuclease ABC subunit C